MSLTGQRIKALRMHQSKTQKDIAAMAGIYTSHLSAIENGTKNPELATLVNIAKALHASVDYLSGRVDYNFDPANQYWTRIHQVLAGVSEENKRIIVAVITSLERTL